MDMTSYEQGIPSWVDLGSPDPDGAIAFYTSLFGWEAQDSVPGAGGYRLLTLRGKPVVGIGPQMQPGPPFWTTYIATDDIEATAGAVGVAGGQTFVPPMQVLDSGKMAVFADPTGAAFGVWEAGTHTGAGVVNEANSLAWNELNTRTPDAAIPFYRDVFGWGAKTAPFGTTSYTEWQVGGRTVGGMIEMDDVNFPPDVPSHWLAYFAVDDADATVAQLTQLGGSVMVPPTDIDPGRFAVVADPHGAVFAVIKMTAPV